MSIMDKLDRLERANRRACQRFIDRYWWVIVIVLTLVLAHEGVLSR